MELFLELYAKHTKKIMRRVFLAIFSIFYYNCKYQIFFIISTWSFYFRHFANNSKYISINLYYRRKDKLPMTNTSYLQATGPIRFGMTNDCMFRAVLQHNNYVLKGLICSLLHLNPADVSSVEITNPIELGEAAADDKEFILDINVSLNTKTTINLEMQMTYRKDWRERSLSYLCRTGILCLIPALKRKIPHFL